MLRNNKHGMPCKRDHYQKFKIQTKGRVVLNHMRESPYIRIVGKLPITTSVPDLTKFRIFFEIL